MHITKHFTLKISLNDTLHVSCLYYDSQLVCTEMLISLSNNCNCIQLKTTHDKCAFHDHNHNCDDCNDYTDMQIAWIFTRKVKQLSE